MTTIKTQAIGIGIDVSKDKLDLAIRMSDQSYQQSNFMNNAQGVNQLCSYLKIQEATCIAPLVIESTGDYHFRSALMIKHQGYNVKVINPLITKRYQQSSIRNAKTDKIDAKRLSDIAVLEQDLPDFKDKTEQIKARKLVSMLARLEKVRQQMTTSLRRFEETAKVLKLKHSLTHSKKALTELNKQIEQTKKALVDLTPAPIKQLAEQTKGLSQEKIAIIHTLTAGKEFTDRDKLVAFFGLDIATRQSGQWNGKAKLSKRGNAYARKILYQIAWGLKTHNKIFKDCYLKHLAANKHYTATLMILARKFLRFYFSYVFEGTASGI